MKLVVALVSIVVACGGPKTKPDSPLVNEGSAVPDTCCCKTHPLTSEDGKAAFEHVNRIECGTRQGECVPDVQCKAAPPAAE
jgi:hypothetical protein